MPGQDAGERATLEGQGAARPGALDERLMMGMMGIKAAARTSGAAVRAFTSTLLHR